MVLEDYSAPYRLPNVHNKLLKDPHVVIVGAGASIAACPKDKNGIEVPLLKNIHHVLGLTDKLAKYGFSEAEMENFELLYSNICSKPEFSDLTNQLTHEVQAYFQKLTLPDEITLYDYLVLSLTKKDAIISFNWDPFLLQAYQRNISVGNLPQLMFPHGNVGVGLCYGCKVKGYASTLCPRCMRKLDDMPLLFPVKEKDYSDKPIIKNEWELAKAYLSHAAGITIFGYGAPETDVEAYSLLKDSYRKSGIIDIAPFTIINLKKEQNVQMKKWADIFDNRMCLFCEIFEESILWETPRVSLEHLFDAILQQQPRATTRPFHRFNSLVELQSFAKSIKDFEMAIY